ncbi:RNA polymerase sigma factor [Butyrivibrio sp. XPD2002]|uniref:RNA polymerase sigma factor n=1 Tax=Butyrivibrio sp. XPD2002 TaxID=1280665 RepID=UPI000428E73D|nr:sigma-70 family RNA polymerase sigma factor [Butyrivibrio sp. XPD2002]
MLMILLSVLEDEQRDLVQRIYNENKSFFLRLAAGITGSESLAEEAVSDAFLKISLNIKKISELSCHEMRGFCVVIVKNCSISILRKNKRYVYGTEEMSRDQVADTDDPERTVLKNERNDYIRALLETLSDDDKELVAMRYTYEMSYGEIARVMDISEDAARKRGQRVIERLRTSYSEKEDGYGI